MREFGDCACVAGYQAVRGSLTGTVIDSGDGVTHVIPVVRAPVANGAEWLFAVVNWCRCQHSFWLSRVVGSESKFDVFTRVVQC